VDFAWGHIIINININININIYNNNNNYYYYCKHFTPYVQWHQFKLFFLLKPKARSRRTWLWCYHPVTPAAMHILVVDQFPRDWRGSNRNRGLIDTNRLSCYSSGGHQFKEWFITPLGYLPPHLIRSLLAMFNPKLVSHAQMAWRR